MNWKLVFLLSLFGLAMAAGTISLISSGIEPVFWLATFLVTAYLIGTAAPGRVFLHGLCLGLVNCVWVTGAHVLFAKAYIAHHPDEAKMMASMPLPTHPRLMMLLTGPIVGVVSGCVIGLLAMLAHKLFAKKAA